MDGLLILFVLAGLFWIFAPLFIIPTLIQLRRRVEGLERELDDLRCHRVEPPRDVEARPPPPPEPALEPSLPERRGEEIVAEMPEAPDPAPEERHEEEAGERESLGGLFERLVAGRLLIWLGGVALVLAAVFLIRYSIEIGLMTPAARMIAAASFGFVLLGLGEYARAGRLLSEDPRIAQALVGAGLAVLYAASYGAHVLYGLIGTGAASAAMVAVTAAALGLSLRHGAPTAVMGLVGGFLTPALIGDADSGAARLLFYLALLNGAVFALAWRRGWGWLAAGAVILSYAWTGFLLVRPPGDALAAGMFIVALAIAAALLRPGGGRAPGLIQPVAIGLVQLAVLVGRTDIGAPAWALYGLLAAAAMALAPLRRELRFAPALALALALALLLVRAADGQDPAAAWAGTGMTLLFGLGGLGFALARGGRLWTAVAAVGFAAPAAILRALRPDLLAEWGWGLAALALALGPAALVWANRHRARTEAPADPALLIAGAAAAWLLGAAVWDLAPAELVPSGWIAAALLVALAARRLDDLALTSVAALTALVGLALALARVPELSFALAGSLFGEPVLAPHLPSAREAGFALALPALLLFALRLALPPLPIGARRAFPAVAVLLAAAAAYVWFKHGFGLDTREDFVARGLLERTLIAQALFLLGWLLGSGRLRLPEVEPDLVRSLGTALTALAAARLVWFEMVVHNPLLIAQNVGALPLLNLILPAYLLGALWLYAARRRADAATRSGFWLGAFLAALIFGTMLLVRQGFQGPLLDEGDMAPAEFYCYSLAALLLAIAVIVAGVRLPDKALRLAGLVLLTAAIVKAFAFDASELEGVWRILSFLGLGVALIGIGRLYGPVLRAEAGRGKGAR